MPQELDQSAFLDIFKAEADDYLGRLQQGLLSLEKDPDQPAVIESVFRAAHTLKGSSRMMGFMDIHEIAHHVEDLFEKIKNRQLKLNARITDQALAAIDAMTGILQSAVQGQPATVNVAQIVRALQSVAGSVVAASVSDAAGNATKAAETAATTPAQPKSLAARAEEFMRVPVNRIDALFNLAGELVVHKVKSSYKLQKLRQLTRQVKASHKRITQLLEQQQLGVADEREFSEVLQQHHADSGALRRQVLELAELLGAETIHLDPVIDELQYRVRQLRMLPCATIFDGLERLVRDTARQLQKEVQLVVEGQETELDKKMLEAIKPCLVHLLRNSVDHGIESPDQRAAAGKPRAGTIRLRAGHQGGRAVIEVQDDGAGISIERVKEVALKRRVVTEDQLARMDEREVMELIFAPGFSTAAIVTDVSGRGVGMDVVKKEIEALKGHVRIDSLPGQGTTITLELPLTVAIMQVLMVAASGQRFGLPVLAVEEIVRVGRSEIQTIENRMAIGWRDRTVPVVDLCDVLDLPSTSETGNGEPWPVVIISVAERPLGLRVDRVLSEEEVFVKGLPAHLGTLPNIGGAAIIGSGEVVMILDVQGLINSARHVRSVTTGPQAAAPAEKSSRRILVVEDSLTTREFERSLLEAHGYKVETAVDGVDGLEKVGPGKFDLVVVDIEMPRMNGFDFCKNLRQRDEFKQLPIVIVTTRDREEDKRRGVEVGAQAYIVKGAFNQDSLLETIERLIG